MRRAAVSIPSNIAEGRNRGTRKDFVQFLRISSGSVAELQTQIEIAKQLPKTSTFSYEETENTLNEISKMLSSMIRKLNLPKLTAES
ncbi:MAG: S23 ribosomal protein [Candidatus Azambacteria bacterium GW2011_GWE1_42_9]|nr:MAG: S23 ribosomal protein [Candidatus Azambacteria bacterium GW2011_GWE1_42_9]